MKFMAGEKCDCDECVPPTITREIPPPPSPMAFWVPNIPAAPPVPEEPEAEVTPLPRIKRRRCYVCGCPDAMARRTDEPAFCEEHRSKK
jgi:hypothetical protein